MNEHTTMTLFERCEESSQAEVGRQLNIDKMRVSRFCRGETDIDSEVIAKCKALWGESFDEQGTLAAWHALRVVHLDDVRKKKEAARLAAEATSDAAA